MGAFVTVGYRKYFTPHPTHDYMIDPLQDNDVVFVRATKTPDHSSANGSKGGWLQGATKKESSGQSDLESSTLENKIL